jgi:hypothetical protein
VPSPGEDAVHRCADDAQVLWQTHGTPGVGWKTEHGRLPKRITGSVPPVYICST